MPTRLVVLHHRPAATLHPNHHRALLRPGLLRRCATGASGFLAAAQLALTAWIALAGPAQAADTTAAAQLARFSSAAGAPGQAARGQRFFTSRQGGEWSCASCHGQPPTQPGQHASTGKAIAPLAPGFDPRRFTDSAKVDKWFRRNCGDVLQRECSAAEKADVMAYLVSLQP